MSITLFLFLLATADEKPAPKFPLGKETTVVTGPLTKDGYVDYESALNEMLGKGTAPERNANVLLWKALGPRPEGGSGMPAEYFKALGMEAPAEQGEYFVDLHKALKDRVSPAELDALYDQQSRATQRPWQASDYPHVASWLSVNEKPLALVVEATRRPDYFNPLVARRNEKGPGGLMAALLPTVLKCRDLANALAARAMLRTGEGKFDEAWEDLLACHRLGRLLARGASFIEALVGIAIEQTVAKADLAYLERAGLTGQQLRNRLKDLQRLSPMPSMADKIDRGERFMYLDTVQLIRRGGPGMLEALSGGSAGEKPDAKTQATMGKLDWEPALRNGNRWFDRLAAAARAGDRAERESQFNQMEEEFKALKARAQDPANLAKLLQAGTEQPDKEVGKVIGDVLICLLVPAVRKVSTAADRNAQTQSNLQTAFAIALYHRENARYPAKLDELAPKYLAAVPNDIFSGSALIYRPEEKGYLFYSVSVNGKDEGGRWSDDDPPGDDLGVRLPLPELKRRK